MLKQMITGLVHFRWFSALPLLLCLILGILTFTMANPGVTPGQVLFLGCLGAGFAGNYLGFYLRLYLSRANSLLVPNFRQAHVAFVMALNSVIALVITGLMLTGPWQNVAHAGVFAILLTWGCLWTRLTSYDQGSAGVGAGAEMWGVFGPSAAILIFSRDTVFPRLSEFLIGVPTIATGALIAGAVTVNGLIALSLLKMHEGVRSRSADVRVKVWGTEGRLSQKSFWNRNLRALNSLRHPVSSDFFAHVRLLRLNRHLLPHAILVAMLLVGLVIAQFQNRRSQLNAADSSVLWMLYVLLIPVVIAAMHGSVRADFKLASRLPLQRQELVARYGVSGLTIAIEVWLTFVAAAFIGALLPFGIGLSGFPSAGFLLTSFTTHLAICGAMALSTIPAGTVLQGALALGLFAVIALAAVLPLFPFTSALLAAGLLLAVHQDLSHSEIH